VLESVKVADWPESVAVTVQVPTVVPAVAATCASPDEFVVIVVGLVLPAVPVPAVPVHVRPAPGSG